MNTAINEAKNSAASAQIPSFGGIDYLHPGLVFTDVVATSRKRLFEQFAELIFAQTAASDDDDELDQDHIFTALHDRERLGCTALGKGIALPHGRIAGLSEPVIAVIKLQTPIDYDSPDGLPVWLAACLLVPINAEQVHLNLLATLASRFNDETLVRQIKDSTTPTQLYELLVQAG